MHLIEIIKRDEGNDPETAELIFGLQDLRLKTRAVKIHDIYIIEGNPSRLELEQIAQTVLIDPIIQQFRISALPKASKNIKKNGTWRVLKTFHSGVTDNIGETTLRAVHDLGIKSITGIRTGKYFYITEPAERTEIEIMCTRLFANPIIESFRIDPWDIGVKK